MLIEPEINEPENECPMQRKIRAYFLQVCANVKVLRCWNLQSPKMLCLQTHVRGIFIYLNALLFSCIEGAFEIIYYIHFFRNSLTLSRLHYPGLADFVLFYIRHKLLADESNTCFSSYFQADISWGFYTVNHRLHHQNACFFASYL